MGRFRKLVIGIGTLLLAATFLSTPALPRQRESLDGSESDIKVAFLFNFLRFAEWPSDRVPAANSPWIICTIGSTNFSPASLDEVERKNVEGKQIDFRRLDAGGTADHCHVLFISASEDKKLSTIIPAIQAKGILTVGESPAFGSAGGMVRFYVENNRLRFEVNLARVNRTPLRLSVKLLGVAKIIQKDPLP